MKNSLRKYTASMSHILLIVLVNVGFARLPIYSVLGSAVSLMDPVAGIVYLIRDFAQRELRHYIFLAMLVGCLLSFWLSSPTIALASVTAFAVGELIDWGIFTFSGKPLSQRLILSACLSAPIDSFIFLYGIHRLNTLAVVIMTLSKAAGVLLVWGVWRFESKKKGRLMSRREGIHE